MMRISGLTSMCPDAERVLLLGFESHRVDRDYAIKMRLALGAGVDESHLNQRLGGRVAILEVLEYCAAIGVFALVRDPGKKLAVALDDEIGKAAFDVRLGFP